MIKVARELIEDEIAELSKLIMADARWHESGVYFQSLACVLYGHAIGLAMAENEATFLVKVGRRPDIFGNNREGLAMRSLVGLTGIDSEIRVVLLQYLTQEHEINGKWISAYFEKINEDFRENNKSTYIRGLIKHGYEIHDSKSNTTIDKFYKFVKMITSRCEDVDNLTDYKFRGSQKKQSLIGVSEKVKEFVFLSYISEDLVRVNELANALRRSGIIVWMDRDSIEPGRQWVSAIRQAIDDGAHFIACFSENYYRRDKTYMDDELAVAISKYKNSPENSSWIIPVRLDDIQIPSIEIDEGKYLYDIQWVDLFGDWDIGLSKLLNKVIGIKLGAVVSGNKFLMDTSVSMQSRIDNAVNFWLDNGRTTHGLVNGKCFFAMNCWIYDRVGPYKKAPYNLTSEIQDYLNACRESLGGDEGWNDFLNDRIACEMCRENFRFENISIDTRSMRYCCYRCAPDHIEVSG